MECLGRQAQFLRKSYCVGLIIVCAASALALATSPRIHQRIHHRGARLSHSFAVTLVDGSKYIKAVKRLNHATHLINREPTLEGVPELSRPDPIDALTLFRQSSLCERAPPLPS